MSNINSINNKSSMLTLDSGVSGDSSLQFSINATPKFVIGADETDDSFRLSSGSALGTNDTFIMTASGENTLPLQPCFCAYRNADDSNVTGGAVWYTPVVYDSEVVDRGNDFNGTTTFAAPVTGVYYFTSSVLLSGLASSNTTGVIDFYASGGIFRTFLINPYQMMDASGYLALQSSAIIPMTAADTVYVRVRIGGGSQVVDVRGNTAEGAIANYFTGYLMV